MKARFAVICLILLSPWFVIARGAEPVVVKPTHAEKKAAKADEECFLEFLSQDKAVIKHTTKQILKTPKDPQVYLNRAEAYFNIGDNQRALEDYSKVISLEPRSTKALLLRAELYQTADKYELALDDLLAALKINPDLEAAYFKLADVYLDMNKSAEAVETLSEALKKNPHSAEAHHQRSLAYDELGQIQLAIADSRKALALDDNPRYKSHLERLEEDNEELRKSNQSFDEAIKGNPKDFNAYLKRAMFFDKIDLPHRAIPFLNQAIELNSECLEAYHLRAEILAALGRYELAAKDYYKAATLAPNVANNYKNLGYANSYLGHYHKAVKDFSKYLKLNPKDSDVLDARAHSYDKIGQANLADKDRETANKLRASDL